VTRITVIASGTRGDVQPAIALGTALRDAGNAATVHAEDGRAEAVRLIRDILAPSTATAAGVTMRSA
jgi:UDP:flavonoid glycosyltransferase YjiC (YdhE family)